MLWEYRDFSVRFFDDEIRQFPVLNEGPVAFSDGLPPRLIKFFEFYAEHFLGKHGQCPLCGSVVTPAKSQRFSRVHDVFREIRHRQLPQLISYTKGELSRLKL